MHLESNYNSRRIEKADASRTAAEILMKAGCYRHAVVLYWHASRDYVFAWLEANNIGFVSTEEAVYEFISSRAKSSDAEIIMHLYTAGIAAGWDENFEIDEALAIRVQNESLDIASRIIRDVTV